MGKHTYAMPSVKKTLQKIGSDINYARRSRKITKAMMSERIGVTVKTVSNIENGNPYISIGTWATCLFFLDLHKSLNNVFMRGDKTLEMLVGDKILPQRIKYMENSHG
jgi:DNA-binding XRE family transcriptional regulator